MTAPLFEDYIRLCEDLGRKAAKARHYGDHCTAESHYQYFRKILNLQAPDPDASKAINDAYHRGYSEEAQSYDTPVMYSGNGT